AQYRSHGGSVGLWIAATHGSAKVHDDVERIAAGVDGISVVWDGLTRAECLAAMRDAVGVILPSRIEASPVGALEAAAMTPNVVVSDIVGHREILAEYGDVPNGAFFDWRSPRAVAQALAQINCANVAEVHETLRSART